MEKPKIGAVYFIQAGNGGPIKIGYTGSDPKDRLATLQTGNALPLRVLVTVRGTPQDEAALHRLFNKHRMQGEWFAPDDQILAFVQGARMAGAPPVAPVDGAMTPDDHEEQAMYSHIWQLVRRALWIDKRVGWRPTEAQRAEIDSILDDLTDMLDLGGDCVAWFGADRIQEARNVLQGKLNIADQLAERGGLEGI